VESQVLGVEASGRFLWAVVVRNEFEPLVDASNRRHVRELRHVGIRKEATNYVASRMTASRR
jgi:hypothetical protein